MPEGEKPLVAKVDQGEMERQLNQLRKWQRFAEGGGAQAIVPDDEDDLL